MNTALQEIFDSVWRVLEHAVRDRHDAFHTAMIGTVSAERGPQMRAVTMRQAVRDQRSLCFHTDARAPKVAELQADARIAWLFYDATRKLQIRANGIAVLHAHDELARERWQGSALTSRRTYLAPLPPSEAVAAAHPNLPADLLHRVPTAEESAAGFDNFCVVVCHLREIEWLFLQSTGHQRARFTWQDTAWRGEWLTP